jgi:hypothetical protein
MKKSILFIFSFALVFALGFAGCSNGDSIASTGPSLNYVFLVSQEDARNFNWQNAKTSFAAGSSFGAIYYGQNPDYDVNKSGIVLARSGTIVYQREDVLPFTFHAQKRPDGGIEVAQYKKSFQASTKSSRCFNREIIRKPYFRNFWR